MEQEQKLSLNPEQERAASFPHDAPAVVTAAAGSGKTTLLVERVIRLLSDKDKNIPADSLAVMTFTRNATKSLREKLSRALSEKIGELSSDNSPAARENREYLAGQIFALRQASISTIDSFCLKIIRENVEAFDLPVSFTIADAAKKTAMQSQALRAAMRDFYGGAEFSEEERDALFFTFDFENDAALENAVMSSAEELLSCADAEKWLSDAEAVYDGMNSLGEKYLPFLKPAIDLAVRRARDSFRVYDGLIDALLGDVSGKKTAAADTLINEVVPKMEEYIAYDTARMSALEKFYAAYSKRPCPQTLDALLKALRGSSETPPAVDVRKGSKSPYKSVFTTAKNGFQAAVDGILKISFDLAAEEKTFPRQQTSVRAFIKLLRIYMKHFGSVKKNSGCLDFSDCELLLLEKLRSDERFRGQLGSRFSCIIVDEFQDSNDIQAEIFRLLGQGRLFYVGDVKQSIYAFRGGNPDIMASLCGGTDGFTPLPLNTNYRSRAAVIDTVNAAFDGLMTRDFGGTDYSDGNGLRQSARLPGIPEELQGKYDSEIYLLKSGSKDGRDISAQAHFVAEKIKELHDDPDFKVTKNGALCRCSYSDFAILLRSRGCIDDYRAALAELGISSAAPRGRSFLESEEIELVLNYLKAVDNPLRDEEVFKVLMSPIYRLTAEEIGGLRLGTLGIPQGALTEKQAAAVARAARNYSLYSCAKLCMKPLELSEFDESESGTVERETNPKLARFCEDMNGFRYYMNSNSPDNLIQKIFEDTDIIAIAATFEDSGRRTANIRRLRRMAIDFEARDGGNLNDFLRFLERARTNASQGIEEAAPPEDESDSVKIMTFHASKGLEVPVCVMAELQNTMNASDYSGTLLISREHFLALKQTDVKRRCKSKTLAYCSLEKIIRRKLCGEELRLLYVAMTRAREKLIMTGCFSTAKIKEKLPDPQTPQSVFEGSVPFWWVIGSLLRRFPDVSRFDDAKRVPIDVKLEGTACRLIEKTLDGAPRREQTEDGLDGEYEYDRSVIERAAEISRIMNFKYPYEAETRQQAKFSVTELAHQSSVKPVNLIKPVFAAETAPTGTEKGNAYHNCMEHFPIERIAAAPAEKYLETVNCAIADMTAARKITEREAGMIEPRRIAAFFESELGRRMLDSGCVKREEPFYAEVSGADVGQDYEGDISIQGRVDLYFIEEDGIVLVDYKSDTPQSLLEEKENYAKQVQIYSQILPKLTGKPIKEMYLYAFLTDEAVRVV